MNPISGTFRLPRDPQADVKAAAARLPRRREGDLRALHGRRRGAQDDVRHLPRGRPGARAVPQADDATSSTPSTSSPAAPTATRARCCATRCTPPRSPARPVENACRLIKQYETEGRGYYGAALAVLGRDARGRPGRGQPDRDPHRRRRPRRAGSRSPPAPPWCATPTRRTRWPRRTPRPAASSAPSGWCRRRRRRTLNVAELVSDEDVLLALNAAQPPALVVLADRPGRRRRRTRGWPAGAW